MSDTESFESVMEAVRAFFVDIEWSWSNKVCARLQAAHDRAIRDVSQQEYNRGFHDGTHSMDAEHRAIAMRLRALPLDGGSHENLSQIARAVYHADFGWTQGACAALRDKLIDLMGGVSDDTCGSQCGGACAADDGRDSGEQEVTDERFADDCGADTGCGDGCGAVHMDRLVTYDVLWNERREAVCELRKMRSCKEDYFAPELVFDGFYDALGCRAETGGDLGDQMCDRLIHLLGGDQPSGIDVLNGADLSKKSVDAMSKRAMEECEVEGRITDELREFVDRNWSKILHETKTTKAYVLLAIADRIDEQFARVCEQQEAVLQKTVDGMVKEYEHDRESDQLRIEKLREQRDAARARTDELSDELLRTRRERNELRTKIAIIREIVDG